MRTKNDNNHKQTKTVVTDLRPGLQIIYENIKNIHQIFERYGPGPTSSNRTSGPGANIGAGPIKRPTKIDDIRAHAHSPQALAANNANASYKLN